MLAASSSEHARSSGGREDVALSSLPFSWILGQIALLVINWTDQANLFVVVCPRVAMGRASGPLWWQLNLVDCAGVTLEWSLQHGAGDGILLKKKFFGPLQ